MKNLLLEIRLGCGLECLGRKSSGSSSRLYNWEAFKFRLGSGNMWLGFNGGSLVVERLGLGDVLTSGKL